MTLTEIRHRRRELLVKRHYAEQNYIHHDREATKHMRTMAHTDDELMLLCFEEQKLNALESMAASDMAWATKREGLAF